jgi:hypothetical protein
MKNRLIWFGHVMKQEETNTVRVVMKINAKGKRVRGRPKKEMVGYD